MLFFLLYPNLVLINEKSNFVNFFYHCYWVLLWQNYWYFIRVFSIFKPNVLLVSVARAHIPNISSGAWHWICSMLHGHFFLNQTHIDMYRHMCVVLLKMSSLFNTFFNLDRVCTLVVKYLHLSCSFGSLHMLNIYSLPFIY